jgi:glycosyltransferase involved in cell wall biosynthesis
MLYFYKKTYMFSFILFFISVHAEDKHFVFIIPSYNNEQWVEKNLESIFNQNYHDYEIIYCDDGSTDNTHQKIVSTYRKYNKMIKLTYIKNDQNYKVIYNIWNAVHQYCKDTDIVIILDGDDWLAACPNVLETLNAIYQDSNIWMTYGECLGIHGPKRTFLKYPAATIENNAFRHDPFAYSPLRTFYAQLFKKIKVTDFFYNHSFIRITCDLLFGMPLLEMAQHHIYYVPEPWYLYNNKLPSNDHNLSPALQLYFDFYARNQKKYSALRELFQNQNPTTALFYFCNTNPSANIMMNELNNISSIFNCVSRMVGLHHGNSYLSHSVACDTKILDGCHVYGDVSHTTISDEKKRFYDAFKTFNEDFIVLTEDSRGIFQHNTFNTDLLSVSDIIVIGSYNKSLPIGLLRIHPHTACIPFNNIGDTLNFHKPSAVIIKKEKLLYTIEHATWLNGSYLSFVAAINTWLGNEHALFI